MPKSLQVILTTHLSHNSLLFLTSAGPYTPHSTDVSPWTNLADPSALSSSPSSQLISFNLAIITGFQPHRTRIMQDLRWVKGYVEIAQ